MVSDCCCIAVVTSIRPNILYVWHTFEKNIKAYQAIPLLGMITC